MGYTTNAAKFAGTAAGVGLSFAAGMYASYMLNASIMTTGVGLIDNILGLFSGKVISIAIVGASIASAVFYHQLSDNSFAKQKNIFAPTSKVTSTATLELNENATTVQQASAEVVAVVHSKNAAKAHSSKDAIQVDPQPTTASPNQPANVKTTVTTSNSWTFKLQSRLAHLLSGITFFAGAGMVTMLVLQLVNKTDSNIPFLAKTAMFGAPAVAAGYNIYHGQSPYGRKMSQSPQNPDQTTTAK